MVVGHAVSVRVARDLSKFPQAAECQVLHRVAFNSYAFNGVILFCKQVIQCLDFQSRGASGVDPRNLYIRMHIWDIEFGSQRNRSDVVGDSLKP